MTAKQYLDEIQSQLKNQNLEIENASRILNDYSNTDFHKQFSKHINTLSKQNQGLLSEVKRVVDLLGIR